MNQPAPLCMAVAVRRVLGCSGHSLPIHPISPGNAIFKPRFCHNKNSVVLVGTTQWSGSGKAVVGGQQQPIMFGISLTTKNNNQEQQCPCEGRMMFRFPGSCQIFYSWHWSVPPLDNSLPALPRLSWGALLRFLCLPNSARLALTLLGSR